MALSPYDQQVYDAGFKFIPQTQYLQNPFVIPQDDTSTTAPDTGIATLPVSSGRDNNVRSYESFTPDFTRRGVFADPKEYGPGGTYEINPSALGFQFGSSGQVLRAGPTYDLQGQLAPGSRSKFSNLDLQANRVAGIPLREIADMYDARMQMVPGQDFRNFLKRFTGAQSNFEAATVPGMVQNLGISGLLSGILGSGGNKSDTSRFAVDNAGYGQGTQRDQFGVFTGGKTLFGDTTSYAERMRNEISEIAKNFGYSEDDLLGLDPDALAALGQRNKFRQTQVIDYVNKLRAKDIEAEYEAELARQKAEEDRLRKEQTGVIQGLLDEGGFDSTSSIPDRDRESVTTESAAKTSKVGGGGYTASDSVRESYRGRYMMGGLADMLEIYD